MKEKQIILSAKGYPLKVYHGTISSFEYFRPLSHFGTKAAAQDILIKSRRIKKEVLRNKTEAEMIAELEKEYGKSISKTDHISHEIPQTEYLIPAYLKMKRPLLIPDIGIHSIDTYRNVLFYWLLSETWQTVTPLKRACELFNPLADKEKKYPRFFGEMCRRVDCLPMFYFIFNEPFALPIEQVRYELLLEKLYTLCQDENLNFAAEIDRHHLVVQRMIRFYETKGYDGFVYKNREEDKGSLSYIIFRPDQVLRLDRVSMDVPACTPSPENETLLKDIMEKSISNQKYNRMSDDEILDQLDYHIYAEHQIGFGNSDDAKSFWTSFALRYVMPEVKKVSKQKNLNYHGFAHTEQVILFGIDYALASGVNPLPVILACALHDCARSSDKYDLDHALDAVPIADRFLSQFQFNLSEQEKTQILSAIANHTNGRKAKNLIAACLWDADRTYLSWQWGYHSVYYSTKRGKEVASMSLVQQYQYIESQTAFLDKLKVPSLLSTEGRKLCQKKIKQMCLNRTKSFKER